MKQGFSVASLGGIQPDPEFDDIVIRCALNLLDRESGGRSAAFDVYADARSCLDPAGKAMNS